jgi:uncharacterized protein YukE
VTEQLDSKPRRKRFSRHRRQPKSFPEGGWRSKLAIGIALAIVTAALGEIAWLSHEHFTRKKEHVARLRAVQEDVSKIVGALTTGAMVIIRAHEQRFPTNDANAAIDEYNRLQAQWDGSIDVLQNRLTRDFALPKVKEDWEMLLGELGDLDAQILHLEKFSPGDTSSAHASQIAECRDQVTAIEKSLKTLNQSLDKYIDSRR